MDAVEKGLQAVNDVESCTYSHFYSVKAQYYESKLNFEEFYSNSLQFLAYISHNDLKPIDKVNLSVKMAIAVLVSKKIYNFGELLEQSVLQSLSGGEFNWIFELLQAYNSGDVGRFDVTFDKFKDQIQNFKVFDSALAKNTMVLQEKMKMMALLDFIFNLSKNERVVGFGKIAEVTGLQINQVEMILMRAMSLQLIKGLINQVN